MSIRQRGDEALQLRHRLAKSVPYERVDLFPGLSRAWLRLTGFDGVSAPALRIDGARIQGSRAIARAVDDRWPDPRCSPPTPHDANAPKRSRPGATARCK